MSHYLAIETSTPLGSVAVGNGHDVLAEIMLGAAARHAEALLPAIDSALHSAGIGKHDLGRVVVGAGPGSFTGLRIAAATAKALCSALELPLFSYSGLAALAAGAGVHTTPVCALFDARRGEVYAGCYRFPDFERMETVIEPAPRTLEQLLQLVDAGNTLFVGDGALQNAAAIADRGGTVAPAHFAAPRAAALLWLSELAPAAGRVEDAAAWEPSYMRESGAERMRAR